MTDPKKQQQQQLSSTSNLFNSPMTTTTTTSSPPKLTIHISGEAINQTGVIEWQTLDGTIIDASSTTTINSSVISGRCVSKQLYINDADEKRKRVEVLAKIQLGNGAQLGTFPSKGIKVISKPSKKRQSIKNMELCIHHGTTISLFNRIRSQTVSTKYLGVSNGHNSDSNGTCFVARTGSWDPFVIWIVDTARSSETTTTPRQHHPSNPHFPPPPAIALQTPSTPQQPIAVHYNQPVVLQCVTTGLVSPVMIIRKVDKGSMVLGGNRVVATDEAPDYFSSSSTSTNKPIGGGECGDEALGDPVSQLHKIAFQIVQDPASNNKSSQQQDLMATNYRIPQSSHPMTYLACLNDVVGMHKVAYNRHLVPACVPPSTVAALPKPELSTSLPANLNNSWTDLLKGVVVQGKLFDANNCEQQQTQESKTVTPSKVTAVARRRMSSIGSSGTETKGRRGSLLAERRGSSISDTSGLEGACWTEDVSDAAVWTIVGTDCATYTFWTPTRHEEATLTNSGFNMPFNTNNSTSITPFPIVHDTPLTNNKKSENGAVQLTITGENLTRDLNVWFGDVKSPHTEYKSKEAITCVIPDIKDLLESSALSVEDEDLIKKKIPLLLVRGDGIVYRTDQFYSF
ncbi:MAG: beta-trefoil DNA-binding domain-containing protein [Benjaminiella poitrasii]|nr:MAG: beta-trefoil DNA-binding domain-containing protein [Benjaminiella poitrasii]